MRYVHFPQLLHHSHSPITSHPSVFILQFLACVTSRGWSTLIITDNPLYVKVHQNIARFLEHDSDILKYAKLCKQTRDSISSSVWRERFVRTFDMPEGEFEPLALAKKYAYRRDVAGWICFDYKKFGGILSREEKGIQERNTKRCLDVLKDLILGELI